MYTIDLKEFTFLYAGYELNAYIKNIKNIEVDIFQYSTPLVEGVRFLELTLNIQNVKDFLVKPIDEKYDHQDIVNKKLYDSFFLKNFNGTIKFQSNCSYFRRSENRDCLILYCFWIEKNDVFLEKPYLLNN